MGPVRVTLLGHASVLVEMEGAVVLMDPVFFDPFEEGTVVSCPQRKVRLDRFPPIDLVVVSHRHPDHFDLRSLKEVPRDCDVICPADPLIVHGLRSLGFEQVHAVHPMGEIRGEGFELFPTRSEIRSVPEMGMVFRDASGTFWNQVDTELSAATIAQVLGRFGRVDLLFAMYASQNFDFFESRSTEFPLGTHRRNLLNASRIAPRLVVPASAGFRFADALAWLNSFMFPISAERFIEDLRKIDPALQSCILNPGDAIDIRKGGALDMAGGSGLAATERDDRDLIRFDPTAPVPELADPNPAGLSADELRSGVEELVVEPLSRYLEGPRKERDPATGAYKALGATYEVEVVMPEGSRLRREWQLGPANCRVVHRIAASVLLEWATNTKSFFYVRGWSRRAQVAYRLRREAEGLTAVKAPLPDLLMHYMLNVAPGSELAAKHHLESQLRQLGVVPGRAKGEVRSGPRSRA